MVWYMYLGIELQTESPPSGLVPVVCTYNFVFTFVQFQYGVTRLCLESLCVLGSTLIWRFPVRTHVITITSALVCYRGPSTPFC